MANSDALNLLLGGSILLLLFIGALVLAFYILYIVSLWKLFKKAGKKGWEAIIPFYNTWVLVEISGLNWWYFLIAISGSLLGLVNLEKFSWLKLITDIASLAANFFIFYNIAKKMHKEPIGIAICGVIIPRIIVPVLGLSKNYKYDNSIQVSQNGPIGDNKNNSHYTNNSPERFCLGCGQKLNQNTAFCENCGKKVN